MGKIVLPIILLLLTLQISCGSSGSDNQVEQIQPTATSVINGDVNVDRQSCLIEPNDLAIQAINDYIEETGITVNILEETVRRAEDRIFVRQSYGLDNPDNNIDAVFEVQTQWIDRFNDNLVGYFFVSMSSDGECYHVQKTDGPIEINVVTAPEAELRWQRITNIYENLTAEVTNISTERPITFTYLVRNNYDESIRIMIISNWELEQDCFGEGLNFDDRQDIIELEIEAFGEKSVDSSIPSCPDLFNISLINIQVGLWDNQQKDYGFWNFD